jgi:hypothetical protein
MYKNNKARGIQQNNLAPYQIQISKTAIKKDEPPSEHSIRL